MRPRGAAVEGLNVREHRSVLINGLAIGSGGGYTVGVQLIRHLALERPDWTFTMALISGFPLHLQIREETFPENCRWLLAPGYAKPRVGRWYFERGEMARWAEAQSIDAVVQLNGMVIPTLKRPTFCHFLDPWPYRREAWDGPLDVLIAALKRRGHRHALRHAAGLGFTSHYLRDLVFTASQVEPVRGDVLHAGLPEQWIDRAKREFSDWRARPLEMVTVSNVRRYKRQELVVQALARLAGRPGLESLRYTIIGDCPPENRRSLEALASRLGVSDRVRIEGRVSAARVQQAFSEAKCFVLMSVCESFGIPAIEAMTYGTPVVAADCCAIPEICGDAAELCTPDDLEQLTESLARVLTDADRADWLRRRGARRVQSFSWSNTARKMARSLEALGQGSTENPRDLGGPGPRNEVLRDGKAEAETNPAEAEVIIRTAPVA